MKYSIQSSGAKGQLYVDTNFIAIKDLGQFTVIRIDPEHIPERASLENIIKAIYEIETPNSFTLHEIKYSFFRRRDHNIGGSADFYSVIRKVLLPKNQTAWYWDGMYIRLNYASFEVIIEPVSDGQGLQLLIFGHAGTFTDKLTSKLNALK